MATLNKERHIKYWLRCLKSLLPTGYTSNDSNRMTLAFFTLSALDLLDALTTKTMPSERQGWIGWIYNCQLAHGGFRGSPGTDFGVKASPENEVYDPAGLAATFFALGTLVVMGDNLKRVKRKECLEWLVKLQREDGSFGDVLGEDGKIEGGWDTRYCYMAAGVRKILKGDIGDERAVDGVERDIDVDSLVEYINSAESYDHGIADAPFHEAHAGLTYCAIGALSLINRLPKSLQAAEDNAAAEGTKQTELLRGLPHLEGTIHWLVSRQTAYFPEDEEDEDADAEFESTESTPSDEIGPVVLPADQEVIRKMLEEPWHREFHYAGFNGRYNKKVDTCYSWWVGGSLAMLNKINLIDINANRRFALECTQHVVGGFGKLPGDPPDILHSYLGLAALATTGEPGLQSVDATMCISSRARNHLESLSWHGESRKQESLLLHAKPDREGDMTGDTASYMTVSGG